MCVCVCLVGLLRRILSFDASWEMKRTWRTLYVEKQPTDRDVEVSDRIASKGALQHVSHTTCHRAEMTHSFRERNTDRLFRELSPVSVPFSARTFHFTDQKPRKER